MNTVESKKIDPNTQVFSILYIVFLAVSVRYSRLSQTFH